MEKKRNVTLSVDDLRNFESEVIEKYDGANIRGPIHLSHGNEVPLIDVFQYVDKNDWVFSTWRNHYHALLHGVDRDWLMSEVLAGRSINISNGEAKFHTSAIVGGIIPIATGTAMAIKRRNELRANEINPLQEDGSQTTKGYIPDNTHVWCFIGDMAYSGGAFHESYTYAIKNNLPITFVVEDQGLSTNTPTQKSWNQNDNNFYAEQSDLQPDGEFAIDKAVQIGQKLFYYKYERKYPHVGIGKWVYF